MSLVEVLPLLPVTPIPVTSKEDLYERAKSCSPTKVSSTLMSGKFDSSPTLVTLLTIAADAPEAKASFT